MSVRLDPELHPGLYAAFDILCDRPMTEEFVLPDFKTRCALTSTTKLAKIHSMKTITTLSEATPVEIDTKLSEFQQVEAQARIKYNRINASLTMSEADRARDFYRHSPYTTDDLDEAYNALADAIAKIPPLEAEYNSRPWNRYYHVNNVNGHIHRNISCTSCYPDTQYL